MLEDEPLMRHRLDGLQDAANKPPLFGVAFGLAFEFGSLMALNQLE
jgi:hypothetical protein